MKKVLIIGASGSLAEYVIAALEKLDDVKLTLFVRNPKRLDTQTAQRHDVIQADATDFEQIKHAITRQDIVYVNLAGNLGMMAENIVNAMKETCVQRIIAISAIGIYQRPLRSILKPYRALADVIEASDLAYTILRPDWFTYDEEIDYVLTEKGQPEIGQAISRKSIAAFVSRLVTEPNLYLNANLGISKPD